MKIHYHSLLLLFVFSGGIWTQPLQAQKPVTQESEQATCWNLISVKTQWHTKKPGGGWEKVTAERINVRSHLSTDGTPQWVEYDDPNHPGGRVFARADWSPPPKQYCVPENGLNPAIDTSLKLTNQAENAKEKNTIAILSWGPDSIYGDKRKQIRISGNEPGASAKNRVRMHNGQSKPNDPPGWNANVQIGNYLYGIVSYHYAPMTTKGTSDKTSPDDSSAVTPGKKSSGAPSELASNPSPKTPAVPPLPETGMVLRVESKTVKEGESITVPVWLHRATDLANINFKVTYQSDVAIASYVTKGKLLTNKTAFESNAKDVGIIRMGFAGKENLTGTGPIAYVSFKAVGKSGTMTPLTLEVTTASSSMNTKPKVGIVNGFIKIANVLVPGDSNGNGILDSGDALDALKMSVKLIPENLAADIDQDGKVTSTDARLILEKVVSQ